MYRYACLECVRMWIMRWRLLGVWNHLHMIWEAFGINEMHDLNECSFRIVRLSRNLLRTHSLGTFSKSHQASQNRFTTNLEGRLQVLVWLGAIQMLFWSHFGRYHKQSWYYNKYEVSSIPLPLVPEVKFGNCIKRNHDYWNSQAKTGTGELTILLGKSTSRAQRTKHKRTSVSLIRFCIFCKDWRIYT